MGGNKEVGRKVGGRARKWGGGQIRVEEGWGRNKLVSSLPIYYLFPASGWHDLVVVYINVVVVHNNQKERAPWQSSPASG